MLDLLKEISEHRMFVYVNYATKEEKETFSDIIKARFSENKKLSDVDEWMDNVYLHVEDGSLKWSFEPFDCYAREYMPFINLQELLPNHLIINELDIEILCKDDWNEN